MNDLIKNAFDEISQNKERFDKSAEIQMQVWKKEKPDEYPLLLNIINDSCEFEDYPYTNLKNIHYDNKLMIISQIPALLSCTRGNMHAVPSVRANMGCGIFPNYFGLKQELFEDKMPWLRDHLPKETLQEMTVDDININDEFKIGLNHMEYMAEQLLNTGVRIYPMDLQGSIDTAHLVYGDKFFYDLYDDPDFIDHLLGLSLNAIEKGMEECFSIIPNSDEEIAHYNSLIMPREMGIKTSEDTSTLLSKDHIKDFVSPGLSKMMNYFNGGYVHYCGKNPHLLEAALNETKVAGINFGNPEMHDMEEVLTRCAKAGKIFYGSIPKKADESIEEYFTRLLKASSYNGTKHLLLQYSTTIDQREKVIDTWNNAVAIS